MSELNQSFKNLNEEIRLNNSNILATQEVMICCFNSSTARIHRVGIVSGVMPEFMFIKVNKI